MALRGLNSLRHDELGDITLMPYRGKALNSIRRIELGLYRPQLDTPYRVGGCNSIRRIELGHVEPQLDTAYRVRGYNSIRRIELGVQLDTPYRVRGPTRYAVSS